MKKSDPTPIMDLSEESSQRLVADYLDRTDLLWCHIPNGGKRTKGEAGKLKAQGCKPGVPDIMIFTKPKALKYCNINGLAIELKRASGGSASTYQKQWLNGLAREGWLTAVCHGHRAAINLVNEVYGIYT